MAILELAGLALLVKAFGGSSSAKVPDSKPDAAPKRDEGAVTGFDPSIVTGLIGSGVGLGTAIVTALGGTSLGTGATTVAVVATAETATAVVPEVAVATETATVAVAEGGASIASTLGPFGLYIAVMASIVINVIMVSAAVKKMSEIAARARDGITGLYWWRTYQVQQVENDFKEALVTFVKGNFKRDYNEEYGQFFATDIQLPLVVDPTGQARELVVNMPLLRQIFYLARVVGIVYARTFDQVLRAYYFNEFGEPAETLAQRLGTAMTRDEWAAFVKEYFKNHPMDGSTWETEWAYVAGLGPEMAWTIERVELGAKVAAVGWAKGNGGRFTTLPQDFDTAKRNGGKTNFDAGVAAINRTYELGLTQQGHLLIAPGIGIWNVSTDEVTNILP